MKLAAYDALIAALEEKAGSDPAGYRRRVAAIAALGYLAIALLGAVGLTLVGVAIWLLVHDLQGRRPHAGAVKLALLLGFLGGGLLWALARGLFGGFAAPEGVALRPGEAPDLEADIDRLRAELGAPPIHRVIITAECNAALYQRPLLGPFGWYRNHLILGLPLLRVLAPAQARSVIAHELGHLHGAHGRFGAWIHRLRTTWERLAERTGTWFGVGRFLAWYAPLFNAYSFVLAREQEREADRAAARLCGAEACAGALRRTVIAGRQAGEFWDGLARSAYHQPHPPADLVDAQTRAIAAPAVAAARWLAEELAREDNREDPHPCLRNRLRLIGAGDGDAVVADGGGGAARAWLRDLDGELARRLSATWAAGAVAGWTQRQRDGEAMRQRRQELAGASGTEEGWERIAITRDLEGPEATLPALEAFLAAHPDHAPALFALGHHHIAQGDERGPALIERAMRQDPEAIAAGAALLREWGATHGQRGLISSAERLGEERAEQERLAASERARVPPPKRLGAHRCTAAQVEGLARTLAAHPEIAYADLAAVAVTHLPERPFHLLAVRVRTAWWKPRWESANARLLQALTTELSLPGNLFVILARGPHARSARAAARQEGARIYRRAD